MSKSPHSSRGELRRLDVLLVEKGHFPSRSQAAEAVRAGRVSLLSSGSADAGSVTANRSAVNLSVTGRSAVKPSAANPSAAKPTKPSALYPTESEFQIEPDVVDQFVSRAAFKLEAALTQTGWDCAGATALDLGQSTGGFSQVLLKHGASRVLGLEVGHGQLHSLVASDPRVTVLEGFNARWLSDPDHPSCELVRKWLLGVDIPPGLSGLTDNRSLKPSQLFDWIVGDLSFISLKLVVEGALNWAKPQARAVFLLKPQFELGRGALNKKGIVKDKALYLRLENEYRQLIQDQGWQVDAYFESPIRGGDGNREFLMAAKRA